jgi:hypothetical protein
LLTGPKTTSLGEKREKSDLRGGRGRQSVDSGAQLRDENRRMSEERKRKGRAAVQKTTKKAAFFLSFNSNDNTSCKISFLPPYVYHESSLHPAPPLASLPLDK